MKTCGLQTKLSVDNTLCLVHVAVAQVLLGPPVAFVSAEPSGHLNSPLPFASLIFAQ